MDKKRLLIMLGVAVLVVANIVLCAIGLKKDESVDEGSQTVDEQVHTGTSDETVSTEPIEWLGWQSAVVKEDTAAMYNDQSMTSLKTTASAGQQVIVCRRVNDICFVRYGAETAWIKTDDLTLQGEPVKYQSAELPEPVSLAETDIAKRLDSVAKDFSCIGVQMAVITDGQISHLYEYGYGNRGEKTPMSSDTKLRVASISKVIVGMGVLSLRDMDTVDLDTDISRYWSTAVSNPNHIGTPITFRQLLTHTSSMEDFGYSKRDTQVLIDNLQKKDSYMKAAPGDVAAYKYNNSAICTAGALAGHAANRNFDSYIRGYFFEPLGIDASFHAGNIRSTELISPTYNEGTTTMTVNDLLNVAFSGGTDDDYSLYAGGMIISAQDMARMVCILLGGGQYNGMYYLKENTVEEMLQVYCRPDGYDYDQCLVLRHQDDLLDGEPLYYHNGNLLGVFTFLSFNPETGDGMVIITNGAKNVRLTDGVYNVCGELAVIAKELWA